MNKSNVPNRLWIVYKKRKKKKDYNVATLILITNDCRLFLHSLCSLFVRNSRDLLRYHIVSIVLEVV